MKDYDYIKKKKSLDELGKVKTKMPQINTSPAKSGHYGI